MELLRLNDFLFLSFKNGFVGMYNMNEKNSKFKVNSHPPKKTCFTSFNESFLKMVTNNAFYFILKALFVFKTFEFCS